MLHLSDTYQNVANCFDNSRVNVGTQRTQACQVLRRQCDTMRIFLLEFISSWPVRESFHVDA